VSDGGKTAAVGDGLEADSYRRVLAVILSGQLVPGMIVRERPLAAELGVSRTPLRQALGRLESEGFLVRQNRAVQVRRIDLPRSSRFISFVSCWRSRRSGEPPLVTRAIGAHCENQ